MKKVLFIQLVGKTYGGVWQVNKIVGEELIKLGYDVSIVSLRENRNNIEVNCDSKLKLYTINKNDIWKDTYMGQEIINDIKKIKVFSSLKKSIIRLKHELSILKDKKKLKEYIYNYDPDYIITSHYQLLDMIPKEYLCKTMHEQHTSFRDSINHRATRRTFEKYNGKIRYLWLTKETMNQACKYGLMNNYYIYNAVRFKSKKVSDVINNKKLITIARFSNEKRLDLMVDIVEEIFKDKKFNDWIFEIYGSGLLEDMIKKQIKNHKQIKLMGLTNDPKSKLLTSSINLNTSSFEGFCLSILEAQECGVPTVTFNFGESVFEEILNNKTGIIAKDKSDYISKLKELMLDNDKLSKMSYSAKEFSNSFQIENIVNDWIKLFNEIDLK